MAQLGSVVLEDSIMQKGKPACAGSKILDGFTAPFDAAVVERLAEKNIPIAGRVGMDEFGIGRISLDKPDGLSPAVQDVMDGKADFALCNDVFGKQRRHVAEHGLCYIRPTYGTVSRYGLIPLACSMDQIGVVCKNLSDGFDLLSLIAGKDERDGAMFPEKSYHYTGIEFPEIDRDITVGTPKNVIDKADEGAQKALRSFCGKFHTQDIELKHFDVYKQVMYILSCAEISNNINRYDGIKFGFRADGYKGVNDLYIKTRTQGFGPDAKLAAVMGVMVLSRDQYLPLYEKAMKIRRVIKESLSFFDYSVIALPCKIGDDPYENLSLYSLPLLAGLPSVSFSYEGQGIQLIANVQDENLLLRAWEVALS